MKTWGQWFEQSKLFSFIINKDNKYRFNDWTERDESRTDSPDFPLHKNKQVKFYVQLIF
jgi:hypothetical protein